MFHQVTPVIDGIMRYNNDAPSADEQPVYAPAKANCRKKKKAKPAVEEVEEDDLTEMLEDDAKCTDEEEN